MLIMDSLCTSLPFFTKRNDREGQEKRKEKKEKKYYSACRIAIIMKFSTRFRLYICLFLLTN